MLLRETHRRCEVVPDGLNPIEWVKYGRYIPDPNRTITRKGNEMLPEIGTHIARTYDASIYENEKGTLIFAAHFETAPGTSITGRLCLTTSDGALNEKTINKLKSIYGWDGLDPFWLSENDLSGIEVEVTINEQPGLDGKIYKNVQWVNKPGSGGGAEIPHGDKNSVISKYGARFRALSGGASKQQVRVASAPVAAKTAPKPLPPPPAVAKPTARKAKKPATMQEAWELFCATAGESVQEEEVNSEWYACIKKTVNKEQHDCDNNDWGIIVEELPEYFNRLKM